MWARHENTIEEYTELNDYGHSVRNDKKCQKNNE